MNELVNPRAVIGGNLPPLAEQLPIDEAALCAEVEAVAKRANDLPRKLKPETADVDIVTIGAVVRDAIALAKRVEERRVVVKDPWLKGGQAVDKFFNKDLGDRLTRISTAFERLIKDYREEQRIEAARKAAEEQRRLQQEETARRRAAEAAATKAREEAEAAAAKGRAATAALATLRAAEAQAAAEREAELSRQREAQAAADAARIALQPQPARTEIAPDLTMAVKGEWEGRLLDRTQIDWAVLGPHIGLKEIEAAIKRMVKSGVRGCRGVEIKFVEGVSFK